MDEEVITWGCNAIYRDGPHCVHNLIAMDYAMQQEIYDSGWALENPEFGDIHNVYFANWSVVPSEVADAMLMGFDIPETFIHRSKNRTDQCVISGKDPATLHENENDNITDVGNSVLSTGNMALLLACHEHDAKEIYMLGYDLSSYDEPLNNIYKGTDNHLPATAKGFNPINWTNQMNELFDKYKNITFYWVDCNRALTKTEEFDNIIYLTKEELCDKLKIV